MRLTTTHYGWQKLAVVTIGMLMVVGVGAADKRDSGKPDYITREVRHELVMLPYYGVFDNLAYRVDGNTVTLFGQVTKPVLRADAESRVKHIESVDRVINNIEVLPLSGMDDQIRMAVYRSIYGTPGLDRYALQAVPPIHIIVKNGHVALEGAAATEADRDMAVIRAKGVPNVFSVENHLQVQP